MKLPVLVTVSYTLAVLADTFSIPVIYVPPQFQYYIDEYEVKDRNFPELRASSETYRNAFDLVNQIERVRRRCKGTPDDDLKMLLHAAYRRLAAQLSGEPELFNMNDYGVPNIQPRSFESRLYSLLRAIHEQLDELAVGR